MLSYIGKVLKVDKENLVYKVDKAKLMTGTGILLTWVEIHKTSYANS